MKYDYFRGFMYNLQLAFVVLKLTNFIGWRWALVLSPILAGVVIVCVVGFFAGAAKWISIIKANQRTDVVV